MSVAQELHDTRRTVATTWLRALPRVPRPLAVAIGLVAGLALVLVTTPIVGRGDYGQWLMTSRYYLGEDVPSYRTIAALPPLVPALLAAIRAVVGNPTVALQLMNVLLLTAIGSSFYLLAAVVTRSRIAGVVAVGIGMLVTDRFLELFAFGGLLQLASLACMLYSVAFFAHAARSRDPSRWWWLGSAAMALAAFSHVGTALIAVPTTMVVAVLSGIQLRAIGWPALKRLSRPLLVALFIVAGYWLLVLLPSSREYVTNPASMAYRGPERLFSSLFSFWPTPIVLFGGIAAVLVGAAREIAQRQIGSYVVLLGCAAVPWVALAYSIVSGAATDYPRFSTVLLAPLVVGAAAGAVRLAALPRPLAPRRWRARLVLGAVVLGLLIAAPLAVARYNRQVSVYQPRDAASLNAAVQWIDRALGEGQQSVLTAVRDGKWLEGATGREALFSQPVRYAFRHAEWQRSVDADAILRSTAGLSNGYHRVLFTDSAAAGDVGIPVSLLLGMNHGGEYVDLLRTTPAESVIHGASGSIAASDLAPSRSVTSPGAQSARITTVRTGGVNGEISFTRQVTIWRDGTTLELRDASPGNTLETFLEPPGGLALASVTGDATEATACFTEVADREPCIRLAVTQPDASLEVSDGRLRIRTARSDELRIYITVLTPGSAAVGLQILDPERLVSDHDLGAALLYAGDPAYEARSSRLEALGFSEAKAFGPYRVLLRQRSLADDPKGV